MTLLLLLALAGPLQEAPKVEPLTPTYLNYAMCTGVYSILEARAKQDGDAAAAAKFLNASDRAFDLAISEGAKEGQSEDDVAARADFFAENLQRSAQTSGRRCDALLGSQTL